MALPEFITNFFNEQLSLWTIAKNNYDALHDVKRRKILSSPYEIYVEFNPARMISTGADVSKKAIEKRACFLCRDNRPKEQIEYPVYSGFELLVNPFPIFNHHFTISSSTHRPQDSWGIEMADIASLLTDMAVFFNGASAGASAPDHFHLQAIPKDELPLLKHIENNFLKSEAEQFSGKKIKLLFNFFTGFIPSENSERINAIESLKKIGGGPELDNESLLNHFIWKDENGDLRYLLIPRKAHRPDCYFEEGEKKILVSPGSIDMAGVIVTPREEDFLKITGEDIIKIYQETGCQD